MPLELKYVKVQFMMIIIIISGLLLLLLVVVKLVLRWLSSSAIDIDKTFYY